MNIDKLLYWLAFFGMESALYALSMIFLYIANIDEDNLRFWQIALNYLALFIMTFLTLPANLLWYWLFHVFTDRALKRQKKELNDEFIERLKGYRPLEPWERYAREDQRLT